MFFAVHMHFYGTKTLLITVGFESASGNSDAGLDRPERCDHDIDVG